MTTESEGSPPTPSPCLGPIKGIGPTRQLLLQDLLHIYTVQDLAAADPAAIETALRGAGQTVTRSKATDWVAQARQLAAAPAAAEQDLDPALAGDQTPEPESLTSTGSEAIASPLEVANAAELALAPITSTTSAVIADLPSLPPLAPEDITLELYRVVVVQPPGAGIPQVVTEGDRSLPGSIMADQPFQLTLGFDLEGLAGLAISAQASYRLQGFAKSLSYRHHIIDLGESHACFLFGHSPPYSAGITAAGLPQGLYRLQVIIAFQHISIPFNVHEVPRFQVV